MRTISKSHKINYAASKILESLLQLSHFIPRSLNPDYHVDYNVELSEKGNPSGVYFGIQLKGIENLTFHKKNIKYSLYTKHLIYYFDKVKTLPVYLMLVDVKNEKVYWLFIQKYLNERVAQKRWRSQKKFTLSVDQENLISDLDAFQIIVKEANVYMKELWPSSPQAAAKKEIEFLESLDSRFKVKSVTYVDNKMNYDFQMSENCKIELLIKNEEDIEAFLKDPLKENLKFKSQDIEIIGSELFKELLSKTENFELRVNKPSYDVEIMLARLDASSKEIERVYFSGKISFINNFFEINSVLNDSPLKIKFVFNPNSELKPVFDFNFEFTKWIGKPVAFLPYAHKLKSLFSDHSSEDRLSYNVEVKGNAFVSGIIPLWDKKDFNDYLNSIFKFYTDLHLIDSHYNLHLVFPDIEKMPKSDLNDIDALRSLLLCKEYWLEYKMLSISVNIKNDRALLSPFQKNSPIRFVTALEFNILGKKVVIEKMAIDISNPRLSISSTEFEELLQSKDEFIPLEFIADKNSKIVYRLIDEEIKIVEDK